MGGDSSERRGRDHHTTGPVQDVPSTVRTSWDVLGTSWDARGVLDTVGMKNERLRAALLQAGLTPTQLADVVGVDAKTIERWISGGRIPYRRHRYLAAQRLKVDEAYLWPDALAPNQIADASESEILTVYPHRWTVPRDAWGHLFDSAAQEIGVLV